MDEPLRTVVAGMIGGALMWMIFSTHLGLLLVFRPPRFLLQRAVESRVISLITTTTIVTFIAWNAFAVGMSFLSVALLDGTNEAIPLTPSPIYISVMVFILIFLAILGFVFFRDYKIHILAELSVFFGVIGLLIPNLVVAIHRAQL